MENNYQDKNIDHFFEKFKEFPDYSSIEKVHQLINNPKAMAMPKEKFKYKPLKFWIMLSSIFLVLTSVIFWLSDITLKSNPSFFKEEFKSKQTVETNNKAINNPLSKNWYLNSAIDAYKKEQLSLIADNSLYFNRININSVRNSARVEVIESNAEPSDSTKNAHNNIANPDIRQECVCDWPSDTIIDKNTLLVELTDEELEKIGIQIRNQYIHYHNIDPDDNKNICRISSYKFPSEDKDSTYNYYSFKFRSSLEFIPEIHVNPYKFFSSMDTLVPIIISRTKIVHPTMKPGVLWWFNPHKSLFKDLPERYKNLETVYENLTCLKKKYPDKSFINYLSPIGGIVFEPVRSIKLNNEELRQIGVNLIEDCIILKSVSGKQGHRSCKYRYNEEMKDESYYNNLDIVRISDNSFPDLTTDTLGRVIEKRQRRDIPVEDIMNILIPVKVDYNHYGFHPYILWFYPTNEFINSLPERIKYDIETERNNILAKLPESVKKTLKKEYNIYPENNIQIQKTTSCTYFEQCRSTLQLIDYKIFPNPGKDIITIEFTTDTSLKGSISLVNIAGTQLKVLVPDTQFNASRNSFKADISGIAPGIYLISINTDKGFITRRLVITE